MFKVIYNSAAVGKLTTFKRGYCRIRKRPALASIVLNSCLADCEVSLKVGMIPCGYTGLNCLTCSVFHTLTCLTMLTEEPVGQICFQFPFVYVYKLLHMSSPILS